MRRRGIPPIPPIPPPIARGVRPRPCVGLIVNRPARHCTSARTYLYARARHKACTVQCACRQAGHVLCSSNVRTVGAAHILLRARAIIRTGRRPARRLVHSGATPHRCGETRPRKTTTYAPCGTTRQTTYCYDGRTNTYTKGRVAGPSVVTLRNSCTFVILRMAGITGRTAGTRLAIRPGHEREQQTGRTTNQGSYDHEPYHEAQGRLQARLQSIRCRLRAMSAAGGRRQGAARLGLSLIHI